MKISFTGMKHAEIEMMFKTGVSKVVLISSIRNRALHQLIIQKEKKSQAGKKRDNFFSIWQLFILMEFLF